MTIEFLCPNGHRIRCGDDKAGLAAKCPQCGVKFRVPTLEEVRAAASGDLSKLENAEIEEQIEFLCPNGHRLFGPKRLQGRPGQCPECGMRFRIPSYESVPEGEAESDTRLSLAEEQPLITPEALSDSLTVETNLGPDSATTIAHSEPAVAANGDSRIAAGTASPDGWLRTFEVLWASRESGRFEVHLTGGTVLRPIKLARDPVSAEFIGLVVEENGEQSLVVVPFSAIRQVRLVGLRELPPEWELSG
ncbi:hypothetical protein JCM19992_31470 [Thermostilla marina]